MDDKTSAPEPSEAPAINVTVNADVSGPVPDDNEVLLGAGAIADADAGDDTDEEG